MVLPWKPFSKVLHNLFLWLFMMDCDSLCLNASCVHHLSDTVFSLSLSELFLKESALKERNADMLVIKASFLFLICLTYIW